MRPAFAIWLTGLPASGKSTIADELRRALARRGEDVAVLESDALRRALLPLSTYSPEERDAFYAAMAFIGGLLADHGVPVIFDATAPRRAYREQGRERIPRFLEVYVECPLEICMARDPKGIYRRAAEGLADNVPGLQAPYEPPERPDLVVRTLHESPEDAARRIVDALVERGFIETRRRRITAPSETRA